MWSISVRYQGVLNVLERYRHLRAATGADPDRDTPADLVSVIEGLGGPEAFADAVQNRQRTSATSGILKADAVLRESRFLRDEGVATPADVLRANPEKLDTIRAHWVSVPGQGSGLSLDYAPPRAEPWDERLRGTRDAVQDADRAVRRFAYDQVDALAGEVDDQPVAVARGTDDALRELLDAHAERARVAAHLDSQIAVSVGQSAPGLIGSSKVDQLARGRRGRPDGGRRAAAGADPGPDGAACRRHRGDRA